MSTDCQGVQIKPGSKVTLHFSLQLASGEFIDSNFDKAPVFFELGDGSLLPGFEAPLLGLRSGDEIEHVIEAEQAFGLRLDDNVQRVKKTDLTSSMPESEVQPGLVIEFAATGFQCPGVICDVGPEYVDVDFNHPLAGRDIVFKAKIIQVEMQAQAVRML